MDQRQVYRLDDTHIYATLEATGTRSTRCTFRHNTREVLITASVRLSACEITKCAQAADNMRHEIDIMHKVISKFPD